MAEIKYSRAQKLKEMGREIIDLPEKIWFAGRESLQRTPGPHHLPQYQETGTYWHPDCCRQRLRIAEDRLKRALQFKASTYEGRAYGNPEDLEAAVKERQKELAIVISGGNPERDTLSDLVGKDDEETKQEEKAKSEPEKTEKIATVNKATKPSTKKASKEPTTDLDKEPPMSGEAMAKTLASVKKAKPRLDNDED